MWVIWTVPSVNCGSKVSFTVIFRLPAKKPLRQHDITSQQKRNHSSDERHIGSKSASRYFSFASSHDTPRASIHPRFQSSHPQNTYRATGYESEDGDIDGNDRDNSSDVIVAVIFRIMVKRIAMLVLIVMVIPIYG